ncbi:hypothetical protein [endosymbiont of Ridgeia piscesae]|uniref:Uncharacterized protein n=1 Tax=endosymbiont of Ridgeia piscesae TaxID=54398 RepID=A0A0T5YXU4_9GAMM|nr:hypothetical protein [endosymbiont of Ridgeia piscesae]KRT55158.1 hypothetical protein Ga0074115_11454 [endosymbiont of Ridgeia piscesae]KRT59092.1 hypothetical protein Ga0076813_14874 [endosymbiont of Ridgeia piscesae]
MKPSTVAVALSGTAAAILLLAALSKYGGESTSTDQDLAAASPTPLAEKSSDVASFPPTPAEPAPSSETIKALAAEEPLPAHIHQFAEDATDEEILRVMMEQLAQMELEAEPALPDEPVALWQDDENGAAAGLPIPAEVEYETIRVNRDVLNNLQVGQPLELPIPQEAKSYYGTIEETHNQLDGQVQVWSGGLENGGNFSNFTLTQGQQSTIVMVATGSRIYQIEINNRTGRGAVIDNRTLSVFKIPGDSVKPTEPTTPIPGGEPDA